MIKVTEETRLSLPPDRGRELLALLPPLNRARGFRLYAQGGRRFVDLWQYGGAAVLGHNPPNVLRELKNAAERGLFAPLPHLRENRLIKALSRFFPGAAIRLFANEASLRRALSAAGVPGAEAPFPDPAFPGGGGGGGESALSLWRPFLPEEPAAPCLVPVLPWPLAPQALVIRPGGGFPGAGIRLPSGDTVSPVTLAAAARAVHDLAAAPDRGEPNLPRIRKALANSPWRRRGIYLSLAEDAAAGYGELFRRFLAAGFLLPPDPGSPLILPAPLSPGEEAALAALLDDTNNLTEHVHQSVC